MHVAAEQPILTSDFIPPPHAGFQVKKTDMPPSAIEVEMRPEGVLRPTVADLAARGGAYIIVSATGSTTDSALRSRCNAMRAAVADDPNCGKLFVDFYDRGRIATWVSCYTPRRDGNGPAFARCAQSISPPAMALLTFTVNLNLSFRLVPMPARSSNREIQRNQSPPSAIESTVMPFTCRSPRGCRAWKIRNPPAA